MTPPTLPERRPRTLPAARGEPRPRRAACSVRVPGRPAFGSPLWRPFPPSSSKLARPAAAGRTFIKLPFYKYVCFSCVCLSVSKSVSVYQNPRRVGDRFGLQDSDEVAFGEVVFGVVGCA